VGTNPAAWSCIEQSVGIVCAYLLFVLYSDPCTAARKTTQVPGTALHLSSPNDFPWQAACSRMRRAEWSRKCLRFKRRKCVHTLLASWVAWKASLAAHGHPCLLLVPRLLCPRCFKMVNRSGQCLGPSHLHEHGLFTFFSLDTITIILIPHLVYERIDQSYIHE
jgi:hypothetical protein